MVTDLNQVCFVNNDWSKEVVVATCEGSHPPDTCFPPWAYPFFPLLLARFGLVFETSSVLKGLSPIFQRSGTKSTSSLSGVILFLNLVLATVEICLAEGTADRDGVRPCFLRFVEEIVCELENDVGIGEGHRDRAALCFERPIERDRSNCPDD